MAITKLSSKKVLFILFPIILLVIFITGCTPLNYSDCNTLLHEGKIIWASSAQYVNEITFDDGFSFTSNSMGISDYDGQIYDYTGCSNGNCDAIIARHVYSDIEYKLYGNQSKSRLLLVPYNLDTHKLPTLTK